MGSSSDLWVTTPTILKPTWEEELPEIEKISIVDRSKVVFIKDGELFNERVLFVNPEFLEIFTLPFISGNKKIALANPFSLLITQRMAEYPKKFPSQN